MSAWHLGPTHARTSKHPTLPRHPCRRIQERGGPEVGPGINFYDVFAKNRAGDGRGGPDLPFRSRERGPPPLSRTRSPSREPVRTRMRGGPARDLHLAGQATEKNGANQHSLHTSHAACHGPTLTPNHSWPSGCRGRQRRGLRMVVWRVGGDRSILWATEACRIGWRA